jgi:hypothetical protein
VVTKTSEYFADNLNFLELIHHGSFYTDSTQTNDEDEKESRMFSRLVVKLIQDDDYLIIRRFDPSKGIEFQFSHELFDDVKWNLLLNDNFFQKHYTTLDGDLDVKPLMVDLLNHIEQLQQVVKQQNKNILCHINVSRLTFYNSDLFKNSPFDIPYTLSELFGKNGRVKKWFTGPQLDAEKLALVRSGVSILPLLNRLPPFNDLLIANNTHYSPNNNQYLCMKPSGYRLNVQDLSFQFPGTFKHIILSNTSGSFWMTGKLFLKLPGVEGSLFKSCGSQKYYSINSIKEFLKLKTCVIGIITGFKQILESPHFLVCYHYEQQRRYSVIHQVKVDKHGFICLKFVKVIKEEVTQSYDRKFIFGVHLKEDNSEKYMILNIPLF